MAKALLGYRPAHDQHLVLETLELRRRVADLEHLVDRLQRDNDQLREDLRQPDAVGAGVPTIAG
jgi:DNA-binding PucR family transcriptional regulator